MISRETARPKLVALPPARLASGEALQQKVNTSNRPGFAKYWRAFNSKFSHSAPQSVNQRSDNFSRRASPAFTLVEIMVVVVVIGLIISIAVPAYIKIRETAQDKSVLNNARQLAAAFDQYTMETGRTTAAFGVLVGPSAYVKEFATVANETYPAGFTQGQTLTITGVAGQRTITYAP